MYLRVRVCIRGDRIGRMTKEDKIKKSRRARAIDRWLW